MSYRPEIGYCAQSVYSAELGAPLAMGFGYRQPVGPSVSDLAGPGTIVRTSYGSGPYLVVKVAGPLVYRPPAGGAFEHWSLCMVDLREGRRRAALDPVANAWINEIVPVEGRLLKLFEVNLDEIFVADRETIELGVPSLQLRLDL